MIIFGGYTTTPDTIIQILSDLLPPTTEPQTINSMTEDQACYVTIPEMPGHGNQVPENISPEEIKKFIDDQANKLIKSLLNDEDITLMGHSMGGALTLQTIAKTCQKIDGQNIKDENNTSLKERLDKIKVRLLSPKFVKNESIPLFLAKYCLDCGIKILTKKHTDTPPTEGQPYMTQNGISQAIIIGNEGFKSYTTTLKETNCKITDVKIVNDPLIKSDDLIDQLIDEIPDDQINQESKTNLKNQLKEAIKEFKQDPTKDEDQLNIKLNTIIKNYTSRLSFEVMARRTDHNPLRISTENKETQATEKERNIQIWSNLLSR